MEYFVSNDLKNAGKPYKKIETAERAAEKRKEAVFDENGTLLKDFRQGAERQTEETLVTGKIDKKETCMSEQVVTGEDVVETIDGIQAVLVKGKIRRVFNGSVRIRKFPSWDNDAVKGAVAFDEKVVTHFINVNGEPMYRTLDGYFISGSPSLVEFIKESD